MCCRVLHYRRGVDALPRARFRRSSRAPLLAVLGQHPWRTLGPRVSIALALLPVLTRTSYAMMLIEPTTRDWVSDEAADLAAACSAGDFNLVADLIRAGADVNELHACMMATPLLFAAKANDEKIIRLLLDVKAHVDTPCGPDQETAMHVAASRGCTTAVKLLLTAGRAQPDPLDSQGRTPVRTRGIALRTRSRALDSH